MRLVRIRFEKTGQTKYISHLDLMRYMSRAMKRAEIPMWYTEGFNPRPYLTFALPLSLGTQSLCEAMDIKIESEMSNEEIRERLSQSMPDGIKIYSVEEAKMDAKEIELAEYDIEIELKADEVKNFFFSTQALLGGAELVVEKLGKKGRQKVLKQINLIEYIKSFEVNEQDSGIKITAVISAGNSVNINPSLIVEALLREIGIKPQLINITRKNLQTQSGELFL
ncbi:MAG: TIGR03936 family radical SAM-associated protein [Oscillospiraceae bacterium]